MNGIRATEVFMPPLSQGGLPRAQRGAGGYGKTGQTAAKLRNLTLARRWG